MLCEVGSELYRVELYVLRRQEKAAKSSPEPGPALFSPISIPSPLPFLFQLMFTHAIPFLLLSYTFLFLSFITCDCYLVCSTVAAIRALPKLISLLYSGGHMYFHRFGKPETDGCIIIQHDCIMLHIYSISVSRLFCLLVLSSLFQVLLLLIIISDNVINSSSTDYAINLSIHCVVHLFSHH